MKLQGQPSFNFNIAIKIWSRFPFYYFENVKVCQRYKIIQSFSANIKRTELSGRNVSIWWRFILWSNSLKQCLVADDRQLWNEFLTTFWCSINFLPTILMYDQLCQKCWSFIAQSSFFPKCFHLRSTLAKCFYAGSSFLPKCFAQKKWT